MPRASELGAEKVYSHVLLIGNPKAGKTHWAAQAAEAGFNLLWLSADNSMQTLASFSDKAKERIYLLDVADKIGDFRCVDTIWELCSCPVAQWNDSEGKLLSMKDDLSTAEVWEFSLGTPDANTVLVIDSWTSVAMSAGKQVAERTGVDLAELEKADRSLYASTGNKLTAILQCLQFLPCHSIVIAHAGEYEKLRKPSGKKVKDVKEFELTIVGQTEIPVSFSKPHSLTMGKYFSDVLWIESSQIGSTRYVDGRPNPDKIIGSKFNERRKSDEYSFANLVKTTCGYEPNGDSPKALKIYGKGEFSFPSASPVLKTSNEPEKKGLFNAMKK